MCNKIRINVCISFVASLNTIGLLELAEETVFSIEAIVREKHDVPIRYEPMNLFISWIVDFLSKEKISNTVRLNQLIFKHHTFPFKKLYEG